MAINNNADMQDILFAYLRKKNRKETQFYDLQISDIYREGTKEGEDRFESSLKEHILSEDEVIKKASKKTEKKNDELELTVDEEKEISEGEIEDDYSKSQLRLKRLYEESLEKYYDVKSSIYRKNINEDGEISFSDEEFSTLLLHSKYLRKIDNDFRMLTSKKHIAEEFDDTNELVNKKVSKENKYQAKIDNDHDDRILENEKLQEQMEDISKKISGLDETDKDYNGKYEYLMDIYMRLDSKLHMSTPNIYEMQLDEQRRQEEIDITEDNLGGYNRDFNKKVLTSKNRRIENSELKNDKEKGLYYTDDKTISSENSTRMQNSNDLVISESIEAIAERIRKGDKEGAIKIYENACLLVEENEIQQAIDNKEGLSRADIDIEEKKEEIQDDIFGGNAVKSDIAGIAESEDLRDRQEKNEDEIDIGRTPFDDRKKRFF